MNRAMAVKPTKEFLPLSVEQLRHLRGHRLVAMMRATDKIPETSGVYIWRYWPSLHGLKSEDFIAMLQTWESSQPQFSESLGNSRTVVSITRFPFGVLQSNTFLGMSLENEKVKNFLEALKGSEKTRELLAHTLECVISTAPPLYVGKADNLRKRLKDHFAGRSDVLGMIESANLCKDDVFISYIADPVSEITESSITTMLEEVVQRLGNPPFTKRIG